MKSRMAAIAALGLCAMMSAGAAQADSSIKITVVFTNSSGATVYVASDTQINPTQVDNNGTVDVTWTLPRCQDLDTDKIIISSDAEAAHLIGEAEYTYKGGNCALEYKKGFTYVSGYALDDSSGSNNHQRKLKLTN